jgi:DNA-binding PadR family transcriptional regulator
MESSTAHLYYAAELASTTGQSKPTVYKALNTLCEAGIIYGTEEIVSEDTNRAPRINYELTPLGLSFLRLTPMST